MMITVTVGESPETEVFRPEAEDEKTFDLGMVLINNSPAIAKENGLRTSNGLVVKQVEQSGVAAGNGIRKFDVILEVNRIEVKSVDEFREIISQKAPGSMILLWVNRDGDEGIVRFRLPE